MNQIELSKHIKKMCHFLNENYKSNYKWFEVIGQNVIRAVPKSRAKRTIDDIEKVLTKYDFEYVIVFRNTWEGDDIEFGVSDDFVICHDIFIHDKDDNTYEKLINKIVFS